ncbi:hypothetical protein [Myxococcus sp. CA040A]|uniref:hypothetical protein n=1 Tax=Myxococcus sp. CA040A TaxID=2741738 RepID=UPI00157B604B|nr:hypothetical protein [Myxococcus sp. CA040A]NTX02655.1 hypothetical protein [Myxococcus sp. CA040A]
MNESLTAGLRRREEHPPPLKEYQRTSTGLAVPGRLLVDGEGRGRARERGVLP